MRAIIAIAATVLLTSCSGARQVSESRGSLAASLDRPYYGEASDAAKAANLDYRALMLRAVAKDPVALRTLVHLCTNPHFDGAGLEVHLQHLRDLLTLWGDRDFASAIARFTPREREVLQSHWTFSSRASLTAHFPFTARLVYATSQI